LRYSVRIYLLFIFVVIFIISGAGYCSELSETRDTLLLKLTEAGFENLIIKTDRKKVYIAYENRVFRFEYDALKEVIKIVSEIIGDEDKLILIPENRKIPIGLFETNGADCKGYISGKISGKEFARRIKVKSDTDAINSEIESEDLNNSSSFKTDIVFKPDINFAFGPYTEPIMSQVNLVSTLKSSLWKGMNLSYDLILPLQNDFGSRQDSVRPGAVVLNQTLRLPGSYFVSVSGGIFSQERYGVDIEAKKYFLNGDLSAGLDLGCTSYLSFSGMGKFFYSKSFLITGSLNCAYRVESLDLTLGLTAGKFLIGDKSLRADISREFGETVIGFFALRSSEGLNNGGISVSIPLFPSRYWKPGAVRVKTAEDFDRSYLIRSNTYDEIGLKYNTQNRLDDFIKKFNPSFIIKMFEQNN